MMGVFVIAVYNQPVPYFEIIIDSQVVQIERSPYLPPPWLVTSYIIIVLY